MPTYPHSSPEQFFQQWKPVLGSERTEGSFHIFTQARRDDPEVKSLLWVCPLPAGDDPAEQYRTLLARLHQLDGLDHPYILPLLGHQVRKGKEGGWEVLLRTEYLPPLSFDAPLSDAQQKRLERDIRSAFRYCENQGVPYGSAGELSVFVSDSGGYMLGGFDPRTPPDHSVDPAYLAGLLHKCLSQLPRPEPEPVPVPPPAPRPEPAPQPSPEPVPVPRRKKRWPLALLLVLLFILGPALVIWLLFGRGSLADQPQGPGETPPPFFTSVPSLEPVPPPTATGTVQPAVPTATPAPGTPPPATAAPATPPLATQAPETAPPQTPAPATPAPQTPAPATPAPATPTPSAPAGTPLSVCEWYECGVGAVEQIWTQGGVKPFRWSTSNAVVADVDQNGYFTAISPGKATITVTDSKGQSGTCLITVKAPPVQLFTGRVETDVGDQGQLEYGSGLMPYRWSTSNASVVTVDQNGRYTAKGSGKATVTITDANGTSASCEFVVRPYDHVHLSDKTIHLEQGHSYQLTLSGGTAPFTWNSSNSSVASVTSDGLVTAHKPGKTTILVIEKYNWCAECVVIVEEPHSGPNGDTDDTLTPEPESPDSYFPPLPPGSTVEPPVIGPVTTPEPGGDLNTGDPVPIE